MASKRSGRMYELLLAEAGCDAAAMLMVGDNPHSDIAMARARGIAALQVDDAPRRLAYADPLADVRDIARFRAEIRATVRAAAPALGMACIAPALLMFIERLYMHARRRGLRHLFFLAREGQMLRRLFLAYQDELGLAADDRIQCHYLLASRRACFIASLAPLPEEDFSGLFDFYRRMSLRDFLRSLRFDEPMVARLAAAIGHDPDLVADDWPAGAGFAALRAHPDFAVAYERIRTSQHGNLLAYLRQFGAELGRDGVALVDVGWKGSIQDFLRRVLPAEVAVEGLYFGLIGVGQSLQDKTGLMLSTVGGLSPDYLVFAENRSALEIVLCADHGSALGYERTPDGRIEVALDEDAEEAAFMRDTVRPVGRAVEDAVRALMSIRGRSVVPEPAWRALVVGTYADLVFQPWHPGAAWLRAARHRENFGVFHMSAQGGDPARRFIDRAAAAIRLARQPRRELAKSFWPALALYEIGGKPLALLYGSYRRLRNGRLARGRLARHGGGA
jgi:hypothetical protein